MYRVIHASFLQRLGSNLDFLLGEDHVVDLVEANQEVRASELDMEAGIKAADPTCEVQDEATWGLVRVNEKKLNINGEYRYLSATGLGVTAYIVDTLVVPPTSPLRAAPPSIPPPPTHNCVASPAHNCVAV